MQSQLLSAMNAVEMSLAEGVKQMTEATPKAGPVDAVKALLNERGKTHGNYTDHARITQAIKGVMIDELLLRSSRGQDRLSPEALESLDMIAHKIGRILAGQWDHPDHWRDIAGYAKLVNGDR